MRFTLVELMVLVAIVMVLAAIALPQMHHAQLQARHTERQLVLEGMGDASLAYDMAANASYTLMAESGITPNKTLQPWPTGTAFELIGFAPDGDVRCWYQVEKGASTIAHSGVCDLDADGVFTFIGMDVYTSNFGSYLAGERRISGADYVPGNPCSGGLNYNGCVVEGFW